MTKELPKKAGHICHADEDHSLSHAGITTVVSQLARYLVRQDYQASILTPEPGDYPNPPRVKKEIFPLRSWGKRWRYPGGMRAYLQKLAGAPGTIFHIHGPWGGPQWLMGCAAKKYRVPGLLSPHGVMEPWHWHQNTMRLVRYTIYWRTMAYPIFRHLPMIHAITDIERDHLAGFFPGQRLEVIPNAVDLEEVDHSLSMSESDPAGSENGRYLLFFGQLHPKKGIDILIKAFYRACRGRPWRLLIIGQDKSARYSARLKKLVEELGLCAQVTFKGPVYGPQKFCLYQNAWTYCLPSHSDVVGMTNLEAAASGTPVITTHETGLKGWEEGGGLLTRPRVEELARCLAHTCSWSQSERDDRGRTLRRLVQRRYSWEAVGPLWLSLYSELLEQHG